MDICKSEYSEIILTTDQDLIKDGVQAISDEFLEWFVNNPSCEEVEVGYGWIRLTETDNEGYWVSIPNKQFEMQQEEHPKQEPTLEEAAEKYMIEKYRQGTYLGKLFIDGAKWQQERMYSEKEVESLLHKFMQHRHPDWHGWSTTKWFEQYKKK